MHSSMHRPLLLLSGVLLGACSQEPGKVPTAHVMSRPVIRIVDSSFPLDLDSVRTDTASRPSEKLDKALQGVVADFYFNECRGDSNETYFRMADVPQFALELPGRSGVYYLLVMKGLPVGYATSRLVKWDPREERIMAGPAEVRLLASYDVRDGELEPTKLKELFENSAVELRLLDTLGQEAVVVKRFWHNGTFNAMERMVLGFDDGRIDTLFSRLTPM
jgi:hypothetical protein